MQKLVTVAATAALGAIAIAQVDGPAPLAWRWAQSTTVAPSGAPVVNGDAVYVAVGQRVFRLDRTTGNQVWRFPIGEPLDGNFRTGAVLAGDILVASADNKNVFGLNTANGQRVWQYLSEDSIIGTPVIAEDAVLLHLSGDRIVALNAQTGAPLWSGPIRLKDGVTGNIGSWQRNLIYANRTSNIVSIDIGTQRTNWTRPLGRISASSAPISFGDSIYVNSGTFVIALRGATGMPRWQQNLGDSLTFSPAVGPNGIAVVSREGKFFSLDLNGRLAFRRGADLGSLPIASPSFVGTKATVSTSNGSINLIDPQSGDMLWSFMIPPLVSTNSSQSTSTQGRGMGGGIPGMVPGGGVPGLGGGPGLGGPGAGGQGGRGPGLPGGRGPGGRNAQMTDPFFVEAAGPASQSDGTLLVLARDGSLLAFDRTLGVDLTPPTVKMIWPNPGDQISGQPPLRLVFSIDDEASGLNPATLNVTVGDRKLTGELGRDGILNIRISLAGPNKPLQDGRQIITVRIQDWMGNEAVRVFALNIDNTLPPLRTPGEQTNQPGTGNRGGGAGRGVGGGGGRLGGEG